MRSDVEHTVTGANLEARVHALGMEGMPAVVIEAGIAGIPFAGFAGFRVSGIPEVVLEGHTGFLVDPGDISQLSRRLHQLLTSTTLRDRMGGAAKQRCMELFDIGRIAEMYHEVYREVGLR